MANAGSWGTWLQRMEMAHLPLELLGRSQLRTEVGNRT